MMDDIAEQQDVAKEISEAISNPGKFQTIIINRMNRGRKLRFKKSKIPHMTHMFSCYFIVAFGQEYDDDELEAELADLEMEGEEDEQAKLDALLLNPDPVPTDKLPDVPEHVPVAAKSKKAAEKDDDLADLEKWAAAS